MALLWLIPDPLTDDGGPRKAFVIQLGKTDPPGTTESFQTQTAKFNKERLGDRSAAMCRGDA